MKKTGIIRDVDSVGRIVFPIDIRNKLDLTKGTLIEVYTEDDKIIVEKYRNKCVFCGTTDDIQEIKDKFVCKNCKEEFKKMLSLIEE